MSSLPSSPVVFDNDSAARIAKVVKTVESRGVDNTVRPLGRQSVSDGFLATIVNAGPNGEAAPTPPVYWVQTAIVTNNGGIATDKLQVKASTKNLTALGGGSVTNPQYQIVAATDLSAITASSSSGSAGSGSVGSATLAASASYVAGDVVTIKSLYDQSSPPKPRFFIVGGGGSLLAPTAKYQVYTPIDDTLKPIWTSERFID